MRRQSDFHARLDRHYDELKWLYCELYEGGLNHFYDLCDKMEARQAARPAALKKLDKDREGSPDWYRKNDMAGMMMYTEAFAGTLRGVERKLDYIEESGINYIHLMPLLDSPEGKSDGGYAVSDFTKVRPDLGTMKDLSHLASKCHQRGISLCLDFVMNHTSEEHEWARRARAGEKEYQDMYFFYDDYDIPSQYEKTCPQVFPTTAPGNFTWLPDAEKFVMTTFYPYQWDLNYRNPIVFNAMADNLMNLTNHGVDIIRIDAVPYIWKELGTSCRNLPQVHNIVRMLRMICEIVCPGVLLLGEVVMEPEKVVPYFGTVEKPECHMLYNVTTMATTWHTVATKDVSLLKRQMDIVSSLPKEYVFLNYLRCHDDIGWGLEYSWLKGAEQMEEIPHKKFLNDFFTGRYPGSFARGQLYNDDKASGDARLCGTTASLCGLEKAVKEGTREDVENAIRFDLTLHGYMFTLSGIPVVYSGDEIGQFNDYSYVEDPKKAADSRYLHRGKFHWDAAGLRDEEGTMENLLFHGIRRMESIRSSFSVFSNKADVKTVDSGDISVLHLTRSYGGETLEAFFNFSDSPKTVWVSDSAEYADLLEGGPKRSGSLPLKPYGMLWLLSSTSNKYFS